jgi:hypothetical protein
VFDLVASTFNPTAAHPSKTNPKAAMLDVFSFIEERGGNPELIRESQRKRHASVEIVDEIIALFEECKKGVYCDRV